MTARIAIFASGSGTVAQSLLDASVNGGLGQGRVVVLASDRSDATALERAAKAGVEAVHIDPASTSTRAEYCAVLADEMKQRQIDLVCLSGFMKILTPEFVGPFSGRILNTHPSLLPSFPGAHPIRDALAWGAKVTGATVHFVDEQVDHGPIVLQQAVAIEPGDTEDSLHERVKQVERELYPRAAEAFVSGRVRIDGRTVVIERS